MPQHKILVVDDEAGVRFGVRDFLELSGYRVYEAETCQAAVEVFHSARPDAAIIDYLLADGDALGLLPRLKGADPKIPLLILTAHGSIDLAVRAVKGGADQFLTKPIELPVLLATLQHLLEEQHSRRKVPASFTPPAPCGIDPFLGTSVAICQLAEDAGRVLGSDSPILIQGETGTGKSVLARWVHDHSPRSGEAFVDLNCASLSQAFLESELFGHERGAFTGAVTSKTGLLEVAHGGTLFLDEIGDMDIHIQPKLLKVLEEKRFRRLGDVRDRRVDIRLIAATHQHLGHLVRDKQFRSDLHFRINTLPLFIPPLRQRGEDILTLSRTLLLTLAATLGRGALALAPDAEQALLRQHWPGNIRELRNVLERAVLRSERQVLTVQDLRFDEALPSEAVGYDIDLSLRELERQHIQQVLHREQGHVESAARRLGIPRSSLYQKIKHYQIILPRS